MRRISGALAWTLSRLKTDSVLFAAIVAYTIAGLAVMSWTGTTGSATYAPYVEKWVYMFLGIFPAAAIGFDFVRVVHRFDGRRRRAFLNTFSPQRMGHLFAGTALLMCLILFQGTFTSIKNAMFHWYGAFVYDQLFAEIDRILHFGVDPWHWVRFLIASDAMRTATEFNYNIVYFSLSFGTLYLVSTSPRADHLRVHYIACFALTWVIVGNVLAAIFLSAGPAYYGYVTGDTGRFAELMAILQHSDGPNAAVAYQQYLWELHLAGLSGFGSGISAFPSIHVAVAALNMCFAFEVSRRLGMVMSLYTLSILASSVALGWHYAIDGYVSIAVVAVLYAALRKPLRAERFRTIPPKTDEVARGPAVAIIR